MRNMKLKINESYKEGFVSIWWYTDNGDFWDFSKSTDDAEDDHGFLQYSITQNHMTLWRDAVRNNIDDADKQKEVINRGYKSIERGRIVFNIRSQAYEIICSATLVNNQEFREKCVKYFNLTGNRYSFIPMNHYGKQELTGNPTLDSMYYET